MKKILIIFVCYFSTSLSARFTADLELLYWTASYKLPYAFEFQLLQTNLTPPPGINSSTLGMVDVNFLRTPQKWNPGVRVGLGWVPYNPCWDLRAEWTYFQNKASAQSLADNNRISVAFTKANAKVKSTYNALDVAIGSDLYDCCYCHLHPFAALRAVWINQTNSLDYFGNTFTQGNVTIDQPVSASLRNKMWGVGPRLGIHTQWGNYCGLSFLGDVSTALAYGRGQLNANINVFSASGDGTLVNEDFTKVHVKDGSWGLFPNLQFFLGLNWEPNVCAWPVNLFLGWESTFWWNVGNIVVIEKGISFQGLTAGANCTF